MGAKRKTFIGTSMSALFLIAFFVAGAINVSAQKKKQNSKLAKQAKITMAQARETAQAKAAGKIEGEELEKEHGKLVYSFDIRNEKGTITEVQIDAENGSVVSVEEEDKAAEEKEKREESREKTKKKKP